MLQKSALIQLLKLNRIIGKEKLAMPPHNPGLSDKAWKNLHDFLGRLSKTERYAGKFYVPRIEQKAS